MFALSPSGWQDPSPERALGSVGTQTLAGMVGQLGRLSAAGGDAERVDRIRLLTELESAAAAARVGETAAFVRSQRLEQARAGEPPERVGRGIAAQVALAARMSPARAQRYVGWAMVLTSELPQTYAALRSGRVSEWRAMIVAQETIWLSREHRREVDTALAPRLSELGDRGVQGEARRHAYRLDPAGFVQRSAAAEKDRRLWLRPAPDTMARLTALLPVAHGVAAYAALVAAADSASAGGDPRGRGQLMVDTLVQRLTGQARPGAVPVEITLVMSESTLLRPGTPAGDQAARIEGYGPIPAPLARSLALEQDDAPVWLRRLFTAPRTGELIAMETRRRAFTPAQRRFIRARDQRCRTPWCDAPIRHADHIIPAAAGGPTSVDNAQGCCQNCNYAKQAPGWRAHPQPDTDRHTLTTRTPTGHHYLARAPDPL